MRASKVLLSISICVVASGLAGCGGDGDEPNPPPPAALSTQADVASEGLKKLEAGRPKISGLRARQPRYLAAARRALDRREILVVVSEPATVLVRTKLRFASGSPSATALRRLRSACRRVQRITPKVSVVIAGDGDRELLRCSPAGS